MNMLNFTCALVLVGVLLFSQTAFAVLDITAPKSVKQGRVLKVSIRYSDVDASMRAVFGTSPDSFFVSVLSVRLQTENYIALIPVAVDAPVGSYPVCVYVDYVTGSSGAKVSCKEVVIEKTDFSESGSVWFVGEPSGAVKTRFDAEKAELKRIFALVTPERFWKEDLRFFPPLKEMAVTSPFGKIRHKIDGKRARWDSNHFGVDLHANTGTPVFAAEGGIIRIARHWLAEGNLVIIDHGYGLVSLYFHLYRLNVKEGSTVKAGDLIAKSGQSGASMGPHLHFEVRLNGVAISPWTFIPEPPTFEVWLARRGVK